jgi:TPP-dependent pyruvate/acetoin dehydrogenase alpha subunit
MNQYLKSLLEKDSALNDPRVQMFANLQLIRSIELLISDKYEEQIFRCPVHLSIGQEAIAVGVSLHLTVNDKVVSTHRSHAHYIAKGGDIFRMLSELIGSPLGCCKGRGGSMHIFDNSVGFMASVPIVGSSLPIAIGLALAEKNLNSKNLVVAFIGDAALETGAFYESLNLAALKQLPLLIVLEDNGYSTFSNKTVRWPASKNVRETIQGMGVTYLHGNGDDVEDIYRNVSNIVTRVRSNQPILLHLETFRRYEHCGPNLDDKLGYRSKTEIESYLERDPLKILEDKLVDSGVVSKKILKDLVNQINDYVQDSFMSMKIHNSDYLAEFKTSY